MILIDTNVLSALMRDRPDPAVVAWLDRLAPSSVWTTAVTVFEIRYGLRRLAPGQRRKRLEAAFSKALNDVLNNRVLGFDPVAAQAAGELAAEGERAGQPCDMRDLFIAGIARARNAALATGNTRHFADLGIELIDPFAAAPDS